MSEVVVEDEVALLVYLKGLGELARMDPPTPGVLYRHFDSAGVLLYIGKSTTRADVSRHEAHRRESRWWPLVDRVEREQHADWKTAGVAEGRAIKAERPVFNRRWNGDPAEQQEREASYLQSRGLSAHPLTMCPRPSRRRHVVLDLGEYLAQAYLREGEQ